MWSTHHEQNRAVVRDLERSVIENVGLPCCVLIVSFEKYQQKLIFINEMETLISSFPP